MNKVVKLGDFSGLTRLLAQTSTHVGKSYARAYTPGWEAPEHLDLKLRREAKLRGYENRIDIYQLGNLLLYLLTGEFIGGEERVINEERFYEVLAKVRIKELRELIDYMMKVNPWERPSADEILKYLTKLWIRIK